MVKTAAQKKPVKGKIKEVGKTIDKKKKGVLEEMINEVVETFDLGEYREIPIKDLFPSPTNPRKSFVEASMNELAESIKKQGMINPITVRKNNKGYEIVAGERRWRAAKIANKSEVPVIIRDLTDDDVYEVQIIENLQRADINPMDEARGYQNLLNKKKGVKYTVKDIADKVGKPESYIYQRLRLMDLIPAVQKALDEEKIHFGHAQLIARLSTGQQKMALDHTKPVWSNTPFPVKEFNDWINRELLLNINSAPFDKKDFTLVNGVGGCDKCMKRTGVNKNLFPELDKKDCCTDSICFNKKTQAYLKQKIANNNFVQISVSYSINEKDVLSTQKYKKAGSKKDKCLLSEKAIYVDGSEIGTVIEICRNSECGKHFPTKAAKENLMNSSSGNAGPSPDERYHRKIELINQPEQRELIAAICKELVKDDEIILDELVTMRRVVKRFYKNLDNSKSDFFALEVLVNIKGLNEILTRFTKEELEADFEKEFPEEGYVDFDDTENLFYKHVDECDIPTLRKYALIISFLSTASLIPNYILRNDDNPLMIRCLGELVKTHDLEESVALTYKIQKDKVKTNFVKKWGREPVIKDQESKASNDNEFQEDDDEE